MNELKQGSSDAFNDWNFLVSESLSPNDSNKIALQKFLNTNAEAMVVVNGKNNKPTGIVDKSRLMTKLMVNLACG